MILMKNTAIVSASLLFALLLTACGSSADQPVSDTEAVTAPITEAVTEDPMIHSRDVLPEADFGGASYHIMGREYAKLGDLPSYEFTVEQENGDLINDTIYKRCKIVEEQYNVNITSTQYPMDKALSVLETSQLAGDSAFDLVWSHINTMVSMVSKRILSDYYELPHIDITAPWWNQLATESLTVNGRCYLQMNYIPFTGVMLSHCLYFNKNLASQYDLGDLYSYVADDTWDIDNFAQLVKRVSADVNGDSAYDENDLYGLLCSHGTSGVALSVGMDVKAVNIADDGSFSMCIVSDRNQTLLDKISDIVEDPSTYMITDYSKENDLARMFAADQGLFYSGFLTDSYQFFREMDSDYGLLPFPKADEKQENYITTITGGTGLLAVPLVLADANKTGLVTEALAIESYNYVYPAIYETIFDDKLLRDEESKVMFDLLMSGLEIDFGRTFKYADYVELFSNLLVKKSRDLASNAAKCEKSAQKHFQKIIDIYFEE